MAVTLVVVVALFVLALVALVLWFTERQSADRILGEHLRERYVVTLKSGETFDGLLDTADAQSLSLLNVKSVAAGREPLPVDGGLILPRSDVLYLQRP